MMSYFAQSSSYYARCIQNSGAKNIKALIAKCQAKAKRGINFVDIHPKQLGTTFTPNFFTDPGRIFLTFERLVENVQGIDEKNLDAIKKAIQTYNPDTELLFLVAQVGVDDAQMFVYTIKLPVHSQD